MGKQRRDNSAASENDALEETENAEMGAPEPRVRIAVFYKNYVHTIHNGNIRAFVSYQKDKIVHDSQRIDDLMKAGAPVRIYFAD
jgi:hypothetical protein